MVSLEIVQRSNARLPELGPGLVGLFVGATSGIGEYTAKAFVQHTLSPRVYIVGRNQDAADRIIKECGTLNKDGKVEFIKADVSELAEVDRVCKEMMKKEKHINLLVQSQGNLNLRGRDESPEGLDRKFTLNFYSRMRFINNLLPLFRAASATTPHFSRSLSILGAGTGSVLNFDDLELKKTFTGARCAGHSSTMNDLMVEEFARREPGTTFVHTSPGIVKTGVARELPFWAQLGAKALYALLAPFVVGADETGARQLFMATSGVYPPLKPFEGAARAAGVAPQNGLQVMQGGSGKIGDGGYSVNWNCQVTKKKLLTDYHSQGVSKTVWEHTMGIFDRVEKMSYRKATSSDSPEIFD